MGHINQVFIYGTVCKSPKSFYDERKSRLHCSFQLAVNRPFKRTKPPHELTPAEEDRMTDYPWVNCSEQLAEQVVACVDVGTTVIVCGTLETRNHPLRPNYCSKCGANLRGTAKIDRVICPGCGEELAMYRTAVQIRAQNVEFVANVKYPGSTR